MPEFILDMGSPEHARAFNALDSFTQGYIEAMFFTDEERLCEESEGERETPDVVVNTATMESRFVGGNSFGFSDLAPDALAKIIADCHAFQTSPAGDLLFQIYESDIDYSPEQAGRDFWFTRNGHGVGFSDREQLETHDSDEYDSLTDEMVAAGHNTPAWHAALAKRDAIEAASLGQRLHKAAQAYRQIDSYVGDDGLVYLG